MKYVISVNNFRKCDISVICRISIEEKQAETKDRILEKIDNIGPSNLVYNGELEALTQALEVAVNNKYAFQNIYADNQAALYRLKTPSKTPGQRCVIRAINASKILLERGNSVKLRWVPGHLNVYGNERADFLAKDATETTPYIRETSLAFFGMLNRIPLIQGWHLEAKNSQEKSSKTGYLRQYRWKIRKKIYPLPKKRDTISAYYQLTMVAWVNIVIWRVA